MQSKRFTVSISTEVDVMQSVCFEPRPCHFLIVSFDQPPTPPQDVYPTTHTPVD